MRDVDARWPDRQRSSDGWIGDRSHQGRASDHNPDSRGLVHAVDITASGLDPWAVLVAVTHHPSASYVILRGRIFSRSQGWQCRRYDGPDPHNDHLHVSALHTPLAERSTRRWLAGA